MSTPRRICRRLLAADRPLARTGAVEQDLRASRLLGHGVFGRVAVAADAAVGLDGELVGPAIQAATADGVRVAVRFALGDALQQRWDAYPPGGVPARAASQGASDLMHLSVDAGMAGQWRRARPRPRRCPAARLHGQRR